MSLSSEQLQKYQAVLTKVTERISKRKNVQAVLVTGSFARDELQENSDIDILTISDSPKQTHYEHREEVDGVTVEIIEIPLAYAQSQCKKERQKRRRFISGLLADAKFVAGDKKQAETIIKKAYATFHAPIPSLSKKEKADLLFFLGKSPSQELLLQDQNKLLAAHLRMNHKLATCLEVAFYLENKVIPHHKNWDSALTTFRDKKLARLLINVATCSETSQRQSDWGKLVTYVVKKLHQQ